MKLKVNKDINITKPRGKFAYCSFCGEDLNETDYAVSVGRYPSSRWNKGHHTNCWLHINCLQQFSEKCLKKYEENKDLIFLEKI